MPAPVDRDLERSPARRSETGEQAQERRLPRAVRPGHEEEPVRLELEVDPRQHTTASVALLQPARANHPPTTSRATNAKKTMLITPLIVKKAASNRRRSPGLTIACS